MAQYDGSIRINTKIDSKEASSQLMTLENRIVKTADKVAALRSKMDALKDTKIPVEEYKEISAQIEKATQKISELQAKQEKFLETGGKEASSTYQKMQYDIDELRNSIPYLEGELKDLVDTGRAFTIGSGTEEYAKLSQQLQYAENDLDVLNRRHDELVLKQKKTSKGYKELGNAAKKSFEKANKAAKKTGGLLSTMASRFKGLALSLLIFNQISKAFNAMISGIKEGMKNLAQYSNDTNEALSLLMSRSTYLKNSLATAFSPIVETITPILARFIDLLGETAAKVSELFSALMGKDTFTKAVKVQQNYADSLKNTASNTKKAAKETQKALAPFDDLRQIQFQETKEQEEIKPEDLTPAEMFETVKVSDDMKGLADTFKTAIDAMKEKANELKDTFMSGFWDGLGDYKPRLEELKSDLSKIGGYLKDIFTDADVTAAAGRFINSFVNTIGKFAGAIASIGLTIATNIVGGIESYLSGNVERIKGWIVRMFDVGTEINTLFGDFFVAFADVFSVFASQTAQDITGSVIQIFADIFGGILELTLKFVRDVLDMMLTPFIENKDKIKQVMLQTLEPIKTVVQSIADTVRRAVDGIVALYDEHIHPFFVSIRDGFSELLGKFLDAYNEYIVPILDKLANKFKEVMEGPVGDAIESAIQFIGKLVDALKLLWENVIVPFIGWIIDNVIPSVAPVIEYLGELLFDTLGRVAEFVDGVFDVLSGLIDFIVGAFKGDWDAAWKGLGEVFNGLKDMANAIFGDIIKIIEKVVGWIEKAVEALSGLFQKSIDSSLDYSVYSGKTRYIQIPDTTFSYDPPALATGTVVPPNREFLATLGDNKHELEVVSPLSTMKQAFVEALAESGITGGGQSDRPIILQLDGKTFARLIGPYTEAEKTRIGVRMVTQGG